MLSLTGLILEIGLSRRLKLFGKTWHLSVVSNTKCGLTVCGSIKLGPSCHLTNN